MVTFACARGRSSSHMWSLDLANKKTLFHNFLVALFIAP